MRRAPPSHPPTWPACSRHGPSKLSGSTRICSATARARSASSRGRKRPRLPGQFHRNCAHRRDPAGTERLHRQAGLEIQHDCARQQWRGADPLRLRRRMGDPAGRQDGSVTFGTGYGPARPPRTFRPLCRASWSRSVSASSTPATNDFLLLNSPPPRISGTPPSAMTRSDLRRRRHRLADLEDPSCRAQQIGQLPVRSDGAHAHPDGPLHDPSRLPGRRAVQPGPGWRHCVRGPTSGSLSPR